MNYYFLTLFLVLSIQQTSASQASAVLSPSESHEPSNLQAVTSIEEISIKPDEMLARGATSPNEEPPINQTKPIIIPPEEILLNYLKTARIEQRSNYEVVIPQKTQSFIQQIQNKEIDINYHNGMLLGEAVTHKQYSIACELLKAGAKITIDPQYDLFVDDQTEINAADHYLISLFEADDIQTLLTREVAGKTPLIRCLKKPIVSYILLRLFLDQPIISLQEIKSAKQTIESLPNISANPMEYIKNQLQYRKKLSQKISELTALSIACKANFKKLALHLLNQQNCNPSLDSIEILKGKTTSLTIQKTLNAYKEIASKIENLNEQIATWITTIKEEKVALNNNESSLEKKLFQSESQRKYSDILEQASIHNLTKFIQQLINQKTLLTPLLTPNDINNAIVIAIKNSAYDSLELLMKHPFADIFYKEKKTNNNIFELAYASHDHKIIRLVNKSSLKHFASNWLLNAKELRTTEETSTLPKALQNYLTLRKSQTNNTNPSEE